MRLPLDEEEKVDIQMSPLIDCVFLLLIFFLVTTMMKKWEMQIPLSSLISMQEISVIRLHREWVTSQHMARSC